MPLFQSKRSSFFLVFMVVVCWCLPSVGWADEPADTAKPTYVSTIRTERARKIPFTYDPLLCPMPVVMVRLNGSEPMPFLLDTGFTQPIIVEPWVVEKLHLKEIGGGATLAPRVSRSYKQVEIEQLVFVNGANEDQISIKIAKALVDDNQTATQLLGKKFGIAGTVGIPLLSRFVAQFDFQARELRVTPGDDFTLAESPEFYSTPLVTSTLNGRAVPDLWCISVPTGNGKSSDFQIDTGSSNTCVNETVLADLSKETILATATATNIQADGVHQTKKVLLESLPIAGVPVHYVTAPVKSKEETCLLGTDIMSLFLVTFDFPHRRAIFEPYVKPADKDKGLLVREIASPPGTLAPNPDGTFTVARVAKSVGDTIQPGDTVYSVDGVPLRGLSLFSAQRLFTGWASTVSTVVVQRKDKWYAFDYTRDGYYGAKHGGFVSRTVSGNGTAVVKYKDGTERVEVYALSPLESVAPPPSTPDSGYDWVWYPNPKGGEFWCAVPVSEAKNMPPAPLFVAEEGDHATWYPKKKKVEGGWAGVPNTVDKPADMRPDGGKGSQIASPPHLPSAGYDWVCYTSPTRVAIWAEVPVSSPGRLPVIGPALDRMSKLRWNLPPVPHLTGPDYHWMWKYNTSGTALWVLYPVFDSSKSKAPDLGYTPASGYELVFYPDKKGSGHWVEVAVPAPGKFVPKIKSFPPLPSEGDAGAGHHWRWSISSSGSAKWASFPDSP